jgi:hypothetical protein
MALMLSSGLIVFVNRQEDVQAAYKKAISDKNIAEAHATAETESSAAAASELTNQNQAARNVEATLNAEIAKLNSQLAEKDQQIALANASAQSANQALSVAQADIKARDEAYKALYAAKDRKDKESVEQSNRITELTSSFEIAKRQNDFMSEQVAQLKSEIDEKNKLLVKYNISPTGTAVSAGNEINQTPVVNINGIVREFKNINGVPFATISLGSADAVTRGMKFSVIDPTANKFLGYFTADTVNTHDAIGRLELRPGVDSVQPNVSEVRTHL